MNAELIVIIRPSFKKICGQVFFDEEKQKDIPVDAACRAAILNHALYWIAYKKKNGCDYWYASGEDVYTGLAESWGITIVRREINALVRCNFIGETSNPTWKADRTKFFLFEREQAISLFQAFTDKEICPLCINLPQELLDLLRPHLIVLSNANDKSIKCICQMHQMELIELSNANDKSITALPKVSTKITTKETSKEINAAHMPNGNVLNGKAPSQQESNPTTNQPTLLESPLPLTEPLMTGIWNHETVVQYAEFRNNRRYADKMRETQLDAAKWLHAKDKTLTLEQFKAAYDKRFDAWWLENKKKLDVTDMKTKDSNQTIRLYAMLDKIEADKVTPNVKVVVKPQSNGKPTNGYQPYQPVSYSEAARQGSITLDMVRTALKAQADGTPLPDDHKSTKEGVPDCPHGIFPPLWFNERMYRNDYYSKVKIVEAEQQQRQGVQQAS